MGTEKAQLTKVIFYISEKKDFWGYKPVNFNFKQGTKIKLSDGRFVLSMSTFELGEDALILVKRNFLEYKKNRNLSLEEKVRRMVLFTERYSGELGNDKAKSLLKAYEEKFSESLEKLAVKLLD